MSDCCSSNTSSCTNNRKRPCPVDGGECSEVKMGTITHHLKSPWRYPLKSQKYYFCDSPECGVVYFGEDEHTIPMSDLRTPVGQKQSGDERLLCYCYGVTLADAKRDPSAKAFVVQQTNGAAVPVKLEIHSGAVV